MVGLSALDRVLVRLNQNFGFRKLSPLTSLKKMCVLAQFLIVFGLASL